MKVIIDIPEETLNDIKTGKIFLTYSLYKAFDHSISFDKVLSKIKLYEADCLLTDGDEE